jgi:hypothetical protein
MSRSKAAGYIGFYSPAAGLAAIIGWLAWSWNWFLIVLSIGFVLTAVLQLWTAGFLAWIPADLGVFAVVVFFIICISIIVVPYRN